jgi:hypothetical protein
MSHYRGGSRDSCSLSPIKVKYQCNGSSSRPFKSDRRQKSRKYAERMRQDSQPTFYGCLTSKHRLVYARADDIAEVIHLGTSIRLRCSLINLCAASRSWPCESDRLQMCIAFTDGRVPLLTYYPWSVYGDAHFALAYLFDARWILPGPIEPPLPYKLTFILPWLIFASG